MTRQTSDGEQRGATPANAHLLPRPLPSTCPLSAPRHRPRRALADLRNCLSKHGSVITETASTPGGLPWYDNLPCESPGVCWRGCSGHWCCRSSTPSSYQRRASLGVDVREHKPRAVHGTGVVGVLTA